jgi:heme/copper-type cytochrome/quinol oxidase subunit 2
MTIMIIMVIMIITIIMVIMIIMIIMVIRHRLKNDFVKVEDGTPFSSTSPGRVVPIIPASAQGRLC